MLQLFQQFTGINLFIQFLGSMFGSQLGYPDRIALLLAGCCTTWFFTTSISSVVGIDRYFSRRILTMVGAGGMCICMMVLCGMSYLSTPTSHHVMSAEDTMRQIGLDDNASSALLHLLSTYGRTGLY